MNNTSDRIVLLESTDGEIKITATEQRIFIVTPFNAAFKDELKARFGARWNGSTREWSIPFRYSDDLDPLIYNFFGVSMIAEVTTPSLMKVAIDADALYRASGAGSEINLAGSRVAVRWGRDEAVKVYRGVFKKDGEDFKMPRSGGSMRRPRGAGCVEFDGAVLETEITPAEMDWLRENEINFELLDGGESAEPQPEDPQLDPEDLSDLHEDDEIFMDEDEDEDHIYVQEEEQAEVESEVDNMSDEDEEDKKMKKNMTDTEDFMAIDPITMDDRKEMEMETKMNEDRIAETKARAFCPPTSKNVVKAWETFAKRFAEVEAANCDLDPEVGDRRIWNTGGYELVVWGADYRLRHEDIGDIADTFDEEWYTVVKDYLGKREFFLDGKVKFLAREWNELMDAITHDESASPEVRQAAEDISIIAFGGQTDTDEYIDVFKAADDEWLAKKHHVIGWHRPNIFTTYPPTEHGVHMAEYRGWDGDDAIISAGGWVDGTYITSSEVDSVGLFERLSEDVQSEMEPLAGGWPGEWNDKILELRGHVSHEDEELLEALWISEEVVDGSVTVYGVDDDVTKMDHDDFEDLGLHRIESDEDDEDEDDEDDM